MNLTQELANFRQQFLSNVSEDNLEVMNRATIKLSNSGIIDNSLKVETKIPQFKLPNIFGETIDIYSLLAKGALVISFYRGAWCPYCNLELRALQNSLPVIQALGANLVAISPQTPDNSLSTAEKNQLTLEILSDTENQIAREFGLVFTLPAELIPIYQGFGIDIPAHNGDTTFDLPIPATYVVDTNGTIVSAFVDPDYTQRLDPQIMIETLQTLQNSRSTKSAPAKS